METPESKETIKLTKNAKGDYQWEIKLHAIENDKLTTADVEALDVLNKEMEKKYGKKD